MICAPSREIVLPERCERCGGWVDKRRAARPFWRGGVRMMNTAGKAQRKSTGKRQRHTTTGKIRHNTASITTCCCVGCTCPDFTPSSWTADFADIELSSCTTGGSNYGKMFTSSLTASFTTNASLGTYDKYYDATYTTHRAGYSLTACEDAAAQTDRVTFSVSCQIGIWTVALGVRLYNGGDGSGPLDTRLFVAYDFDCAGGTGIANAFTAYSVPSGTINTGNFATLGKNGTVTLTPNA